MSTKFGCFRYTKETKQTNKRKEQEKEKEKTLTKTNQIFMQLLKDTLPEVFGVASSISVLERDQMFMGDEKFFLCAFAFMSFGYPTLILSLSHVLGLDPFTHLIRVKQIIKF